MLTPEQLDSAAASLVNTSGTLLGTAVASKAGTSQGTAVGVVAANPNSLMGRDANGRAQIATPAAAADIASKGYVDTTLTGYVANTAKGVANGVASLNSGGQVPAAQLPTMVTSVNGSTGAVSVGGSTGAANEVVKLDGSARGYISGALHITSGGDVSLTSTAHPLQIGPENTDLSVDTQQTLWDNNEMASRNWNHLTQKWELAGFGMNVSYLNVNSPGTFNVSGGKATIYQLDLTYTGDASATSDGALVIGPRNGLNLTLDQNEGVWRNNGVVTGYIASQGYVDGKFTDTGWLNIPLNNSFNVSGGRFARYRVKNGICYFTCAVTRSSAWTAGMQWGTLPSSARPTETILCAAFQGTPFSKVEVLDTGALILDAVGNGVDFTSSGSWPVG